MNTHNSPQPPQKTHTPQKKKYTPKKKKEKRRKESPQNFTQMYIHRQTQIYI